MQASADRPSLDAAGEAFHGILIGEEEDAMSRWMDVSVALHDGMVRYPGDPEVHVRRILDMEWGDQTNVSELAFSVHTGTHMDAPRHFVREGSSIDHAPLDVLIGVARVVALDVPFGIGPADLEPLEVRTGERLLFRTRNSPRCWAAAPRFVEDFVHLTAEGAEYLARRQVALVGIDYLSIGEFPKGDEAHRVLLGAGVWILEGLDLSAVEPGEYDLVCLPMRIAGCDGAPARVVLGRRDVTPVPGSGRV